MLESCSATDRKSAGTSFGFISSTVLQAETQMMSLKVKCEY